MKKFRKFDFETVCEDISVDGKGVVKFDGREGYIDNLLPGERAIITCTWFGQNKNLFGKVKELKSKSKDRVSPPCKYFESCGGCSLQHMSYEASKKFKQEAVKTFLKEIGNIDFDVEDTIGMEDPSHYRNKIQMPIKMNYKHQIVSGFYKENTHEICEVDECYIENEKADKIINSIKIAMKHNKIMPYDEDRNTGIIRHVLVRVSNKYDEIMVVLITNAESFPGRNNLVKEIIKLEPNISTIIQNVNTRDTNVILGEKERVLFGKGFIKDNLCGVDFIISAKSFFQVNPRQTEKLYETAIDLAKLTGEEKVLDAYCGIGTIGLIAAKKAKEVVGVEIVESAVKDAKKNAEISSIKNASFFQGDAGDFIVNYKKKGVDFDVVFMDPPRKGSDEKFLSTILETKPKKVIYISCGPESLARDLKFLKKGYEIKKVVPVDLFPFTYHVETVVLLEKKPQKYGENSPI